MDCLFCKIISGEIPSGKVYEDEWVYAFRDIAPQAPVHILVVPKTHIASADEISAENAVLVSRIFEVIPKIAKAEGLQNGYRVVTNVGEDGCQSVKHLHFHILGGKQLAGEMA
ncbi:MAG: histidine triad nucleotide-binding protein [Ruminococcaceae bacterium]|nr:histidine triad nucleotide-binding protein [Oscillospiraceae bacterium]